MKPEDKMKAYILGIIALSSLITIGISSLIKLNILSFIIFFIPSTEIAIQIVQYILSKIIKPKPIPKLDFFRWNRQRP